MKNLNVFITILVLVFTFNTSAQVAPTTGKKILEVKESHVGEYLQEIKESLSKEVEDNFKKIATKKLIKYGFTDITITEVGQVAVPEGWATKMGSLVSNKSLGQSQLVLAKTHNERVRAINKMYEPEDEDGVDWKFQINFIDNITGELFKLRVSNLRSPIYIIKESFEDFCSQITREEDKFSDKVTYRSPMSYPIIFSKINQNDNVKLYMAVYVNGRTISVGKKGLFLLFDDGTIFEKGDVEINSEVQRNGRGYEYSAFFELSSEDIEKLLQNIITDVKLYIYEGEIEDGIRIQEYLKCILEK